MDHETATLQSENSELKTKLTDSIAALSEARVETATYADKVQSLTADLAASEQQLQETLAELQHLRLETDSTSGQPAEGEPPAKIIGTAETSATTTATGPEQHTKAQDDVEVASATSRQRSSQDSTRADKWPTGRTIDVDTEDGLEVGAVILGPSTTGNKKERQIQFSDGVIDDWPVEDFREQGAHSLQANSGLSLDKVDGPPEEVVPTKAFHCKQEKDAVKAGLQSVNRKVKIQINGRGLSVHEDKAAWPKELSSHSFEQLVSWELRTKRKDIITVRNLKLLTSFSPRHLLNIYCFRSSTLRQVGALVFPALFPRRHHIS